MKVSVQLTSVATGEVQFVEVEASSEDEAIAMFDASKYDVSIDRPGEMEQASRKRIEQLQRHSDAVEKAVQNHLVGKLWAVVVIGAVMAAMGLVALLNGLADRGSSDPVRPKKSEVQESLGIEVLRSR
ncbi:hypothetical protein AB1K70_19420 [Bremerella sp. JC770]|uniref:hypothetical protein n=1 Tax=Bremerella sp. JC770 TaxID=3232137 RepID=UPI0034576BA9